METDSDSRSDIREQFVFFANELNNRFPELDLRFNLKGNTSRVRFYPAAVTSDVNEIDLLSGPTERLIYDAMFAIKEVAGLYDD